MDDIVTLLKRLQKANANNIKVCMPAKIETYDHTLQQASIKIDMKELYENGKEIDYPVVSNVPVVFMASGGASITMPVLRGDTCLAVFFDRDMGSWLSGNSGNKPNSTRMHDLSDAVAIMGLFPFTPSGKPENNTDVVIKYAGSKISLKPEGIISIENSGNVNINSKSDINITANKDVKIKCINADVTTSSSATVTSENTTITASNTIKFDGNDVNIVCKQANITASDTITTSSINFSHTGNMTIKGNFILDGQGSGANGGAIVFTGGITNTGNIINTGNILNTGDITNTGGAITSGSVDLENHGHMYQEAEVDGAGLPVINVPAQTTLTI
jgi:hypothetical protein